MQHPITLIEPKKLHIFVSHMWARDDAYRKLLHVMTSLFGNDFVDHSIPKSAALQLMSAGPEALEEEKQLQRLHLQTCRDQIVREEARLLEVIKQLADLAPDIGVAKRNDATRRTLYELENRLARPDAMDMGQRRLQSELAYLNDLRARAASLPSGNELMALETAQFRLKTEQREIERSLNHLRDEVYSRERRLIILEQIQDSSSYNVYRHENVLMRAIRDPNAIVRLHPNLALTIYDRIRSSDVIFMLVGVNDLYRDWMSFESDLVTDMHKPIIMVQPDWTISPPPELVRYSRMNSVRIDEQDIGTNLRGIFGDLLLDISQWSFSAWR